VFGGWMGQKLFVKSTEKREISDFPDWNRPLAVQFVARDFRCHIIYKCIKIDWCIWETRGKYRFFIGKSYGHFMLKSMCLIKADPMEVSCPDVKMVEPGRWTAFMETDMNLWVA
jgi:hypothetical protein